MVIAAIISIAIVVIAIAILLAILLYHQMLLTNEVNKRLLLITKESIDNERSTQEELNSLLQQIQDKADEIHQQEPVSSDNEPPFNPHEYIDNNLDL